MGTIYCIENIVNNKKYIGSTSNDVSKRWGSHRRALKNEKHVNNHLQNAYNKYGVESFKYWIVEDDVLSESLLDREGYWQRFYSALNPKFGYNDVEELSGGARRLSEETKLRISEGKIGEKNPFYGKTHSYETRQKISENHPDMSGENNPMYGKITSDETRRKLSEALKGENNPNYGKRKSDEVCRKMSELAQFKYIGEDNPHAKLTEVQVIEIIDLLKQDMLTQKEIGKMYGVTRRTIKSIKLNEKWKHVPR